MIVFRSNNVYKVVRYIRMYINVYRWMHYTAHSFSRFLYSKIQTINVRIYVDLSIEWTSRLSLTSLTSDLLFSPRQYQTIAFEKRMTEKERDREREKGQGECAPRRKRKRWWWTTICTFLLFTHKEVYIVYTYNIRRSFSIIQSVQ